MTNLSYNICKLIENLQLKFNRHRIPVTTALALDGMKNKKFLNDCNFLLGVWEAVSDNI